MPWKKPSAFEMVGLLLPGAAFWPLVPTGAAAGAAAAAWPALRPVLPLRPELTAGTERLLLPLVVAACMVSAPGSEATFMNLRM